MPVCAFSQGWQRTFGDATGPDFFYALTKTVNGGAISVGSTPEIGNASTDVFLVRTDAFGQAFFTKNYGNPNEKESGQALIALSDGSILVGGSFENATDTSTFLLKTDGFGNLIWRKNTGLANSKIWGGCQTTDGFFVFCGEQEFGNQRSFFFF